MAYSNVASKEQFASVLIWLCSGNCKPILRLRIGPVKKKNKKTSKNVVNLIPSPLSILVPYKKSKASKVSGQN